MKKKNILSSIMAHAQHLKISHISKFDPLNVCMSSTHSFQNLKCLSDKDTDKKTDK